MTSEDEKLLHKQFLRVHREEEEDSWISGEELRTEGSSGSDEEAPRRKTAQKKSRRRRSEGYNPPESRLSLPNLNDNKFGIAFQLTRPNTETNESTSKAERFSIAGNLTKEEVERIHIDNTLERMKTRSSLDKNMELEESLESRDWRPKRGSLKLPNLEEAFISSSNFMDHKNFNSNNEQCSILPEIGNKKRVHFSDDLNKIKNETKSQDELTEKYDHNLNSYQDFSSTSNSTYNFFNKYDSNEESNEEEEENMNSKYENKKVDVGVQHFIGEIRGFYNEMCSRLKTLRECPVLKESEILPIDPEDISITESKYCENMFGELKDTPELRKALGIINKMDNDISNTIAKFGEEREERLKIQQKLMEGISEDRNSQFFLHLCDFEAKSNENLKNIELDDKEHGIKNKRRGKQNFIEKNIEMAKLGMNLSLSDEQKQRLEKILGDISITNPINKKKVVPSVGILEDNNTPEMITTAIPEDIYQNCTINAFRLSDDHKKKLIEIDSALEAFEQKELNTSNESNIAIDLVKSLKDVDEKLSVINAQYEEGQELLEKNRKKMINFETNEENFGP